MSKSKKHLRSKSEPLPSAWSGVLTRRREKVSEAKALREQRVGERAEPKGKGRRCCEASRRWEVFQKPDEGGNGWMKHAGVCECVSLPGRYSPTHILPMMRQPAMEA